MPTLSGHPEEIVRSIQTEHLSAHIFIIDLDDKKEYEEFPFPDEVEDIDKENEVPHEAPQNIVMRGAGLRVLKLLRLKGFQQHCIVYSERSREDFLLESPLNTILGSVGITFVTLDGTPITLEYERLQRQFAPRDLTAYFAAEGGLASSNNSLANSWGVWKLWEVQRAVEGITTQRVDDIERSFGQAYEDMNTYDGLLVRYLRGNPFVDINKSLNEKMLLWGELLEQEQAVHAQWEAEQVAIETLRKSIEIWSNDRDANPADADAGRAAIRALEASVGRASSILAKCQAIKMERQSINARKYTANMRLSREVNRLSDNTFEGLRKALQAKPPRIVFVDPRAYDGWAQILQRVIYGKEQSEYFHILVPTADDDYKTITKSIHEAVDRANADLIILDLHLQGDQGLASALENASGMQLLSDLSDSLACPVLIASTADKMLNYRDLLAWGATASWTKQSLSDRSDVESTVSNYVSLLQIIHTLCFNETINFCYRELLPWIQDVEDAKAHHMWWESGYEWQSPAGYKHTRPVRQKILDILYGAYGHMRELIGSTIISGVSEELSEGDNSLIVMEIFHAMEYMYNFEPVDPHTSPFVQMHERIGMLTPQVSSSRVNETMLKPRNVAIHAGRISRLELRRFIAYFFDFLEGRGYHTETINPEEYYISTVTYIHEKSYMNKDLIFLKNETLRFEEGRNRITLREDEVIKCGYVMEDIVPEYTRIRHKILIDRNRQGKLSYYAHDIEIVTDK